MSVLPSPTNSMMMSGPGIAEQLLLVEVVPQFAQIERPPVQTIFNVRGVPEGAGDDVITTPAHESDFIRVEEAQDERGVCCKNDLWYVVPFGRVDDSFQQANDL